MQAFTLIELMVGLAIIAVLYTLAKPRYNNFIATARRAEAQNMLSHIGALQQAYKQDEGAYFFDSTTAPASAELNKYRKYGKTPSGNIFGGRKIECHKNGLYLHVEDCDALRYWYWLDRSPTNASHYGYVAIAHSKNDEASNSIYPGCTPSGSGGGGNIAYTSAGTSTANWSKNPKGDMLVATDRKGPEVYADIMKECK